MPRQKPRRTDIDTRLRNMTEILGRPGMAGLSRVGGRLSGVNGGVSQSVLFNSTTDDDASSSTSAQLLVMSATADSVASGGDYVAFGSVVARHGFTGVPVDAGTSWMHPVSGVYGLTYEHAWDSYTGGGTVALEVDGTLIPEGTIMAGTAGQEGRGTIFYVAESGQVGKIKVTQSSGSAQTCDALVRVVITDPKTSSPAAVADAIGVVSYGTQDSEPYPEYVGNPTGWVDGSAEWIWHTAPPRPEGEEGWFRGLVDSTSARAVTVEFAADDTCTVWLNGTSLGTITTSISERLTASVTLQAGANQFDVYGINDGTTASHPAGVLLSVQDASTGEVLFRTNETTGWTGYTAQPAWWTH